MGYGEWIYSITNRWVREARGTALLLNGKGDESIYVLVY